MPDVGIGFIDVDVCPVQVASNAEEVGLENNGENSLTDVVQEVSGKSKPMERDPIEVSCRGGRDGGLFATNSEHCAPCRLGEKTIVEVFMSWCDGARNAKFEVVSIVNKREEIEVCGE